jgi:hypothetical protein
VVAVKPVGRVIRDLHGNLGHEASRNSTEPRAVKTVTASYRQDLIAQLIRYGYDGLTRKRVTRNRPFTRK